jgi:hypothetical protein
VHGEKEASRRDRIRCRTTPRHYRRTLGRRGSGRRVVGEEEAGNRVVAGDARGGSSAPATAATDGIGGACQGRRKRRGRSVAEEEGGVGWGHRVQGGGRGRGRPTGAGGAACGWEEGGVQVG